MARPLRIELAGGLYHVTSRGDGREDIFLDDADRLAWMALFGQVCQRFNWICHAGCLMDNHCHIVVETIGRWCSSSGVLLAYSFSSVTRQEFRNSKNTLADLLEKF